MRLHQTFKALSDPTRRQIIENLKKQSMTAGDIAALFPSLTQATVSHHLTTLKEAGLIVDHKQGKYIHYELEMSVIEEAFEWLVKFRGE